MLSFRPVPVFSCGHAVVLSHPTREIHAMADEDAAPTPPPERPVTVDTPAPAPATETSREGAYRPAHGGEQAEQPAGGSTAPPLDGGGLNAGKLAIGLVVAVLVGWGVNILLPPIFEVPPELLDVQLGSPPEAQEALDVAQAGVNLRNGVIYFGILGLALGIVPIVLGITQSAGKAIGLGLGSGLVGGLLAYLAASQARAVIATGTVFPLVGNLHESMGGDIVVHALAGIFVSLPVFVGVLVFGGQNAGQKAISAPLAGLLAGLLFPILATFVLPTEKSEQFPIRHPGMLALWLITLAVFVLVFTATTGDRKSKGAKATPTS